MSDDGIRSDSRVLVVRYLPLDTMFEQERQLTDVESFGLAPHDGNRTLEVRETDGSLHYFEGVRSAVWLSRWEADERTKKHEAELKAAMDRYRARPTPPGPALLSPGERVIPITTPKRRRRWFR